MTYSIIDLGALPGFSSSVASAVNDKGQIVGTLQGEDDPLSSRAFFWEDGTMHLLGLASLKAINISGQAVGFRFPASDMSSMQAVTYQNGSVSRLIPARAGTSNAYGINDAGQIVGYMQVPPHEGQKGWWRGAFMYEKGKKHFLKVPEGYSGSGANAINSHGQIVGQVRAGDWGQQAKGFAEHAVLWDKDEVILLGTLLGFHESRAIGINNRGQVLARALCVQNEAMYNMTKAIFEGQSAKEAAAAFSSSAPLMRQQSFLWDRGQMQQIDGLAEALNDAGQIVGWSGCSEEITASGKNVYAFLWQSGHMTDLDDLLPSSSGWALTRANAINRHGQIVGAGKRDGQRRAFLLSPPGMLSR